MSADGIPVVVEGTARADLETTFDVIVPIDLTKIFRGYGPLPSVTGTRDQSGEWDHVGATRVVSLSDGSEAGEEIQAYERPRYFAYRVGPFEAPPLRFLIVDAYGEWWFSENEAGGTVIRWSYTFRQRRLAPLARLVIAPLWRSYARRVLALAIQEVERKP